MKITSRFTKIAVASGLIVATGAAVLGITGFASAQVAQRSNVVAVARATDTRIDPPSPLATVSKVLGITEAELKTELKAGKSIADVAKAKNIDVATVKAALVAVATARIDTMLTTAGLPARGPQSKSGMGGHEGKGGPGKFMTATLAQVLKLSSTELKMQLHSGKSLADVAKAQSVDIADVKTALTTDFSARLAEEVAAGKHTAAEGATKLAEFTTNLDTMVNRVGPAGGMRGKGRGPGGHGPMGHGAPPAQNTSASA